MAEEEAETQTVKLKIHYTFDVEHKNDHLSKPPQSQQLPTFVNEEGCTIGVIHLRTCLDAVVSSSPELTASLDNDFTVYAYDYSEMNAPLVGQGMLSRVLGEEGDSEAMITGKITKNAMAKFSKNALPFLEVKLRFTPISSGLQRGRSGSMSSVTSGVHQQFTGFPQGHIDMPRPQSPAELQRFDDMQRMLSEGAPRRDSTYNSFSSGSRPVSRSGSRPGTPTQHYQLPAQPPVHARHNSQIASQISPPARHDSFSGYYSADEQFEEGPARKRARTMPVKQPTKSDLNIERLPDSLRVVASSASSVRLHRPTPVNPLHALQHGLSAEEPIRPPTPIPQSKRTQRGRPKKREYPNLELSSRRQSSPAVEPPQPSRPPQSSMSPDDTRQTTHHENNTSTPMDLPSSPPVAQEQRGIGTSPQINEDVQHDTPFESGTAEPMLDPPTVRDMDDLNMADVSLVSFTNNVHDVQPFGAMNFDLPQDGYFPVFDDDSTFGGPTPQGDPSPAPQPTHIPHPTVPLQESNGTMLPPIKAQTQMKSSTGSARFKNPMLAPRPAAVPQLFRGPSLLPKIPASDPIDRSFRRSNTWGQPAVDGLMSDSAAPGETRKGKGGKKIGKDQTSARLDAAIATGVMPPFCDNCGAIETPAWRRAYARIFHCAFEDVEVSDAPGQCCFKEVYEHNSDGSVKSVKGYKREKLPGDKSTEWFKLNFCNPCGLWFHKQKFPRPKEKWQKNTDGGKKKRKRPPRKPRTREQPPRTASTYLDSEAQEPASDDSSPADTTADDEAEDAMTVNEDVANDGEEPELPPLPPRSASAVPRRSAAFVIDSRQVQSSPLKQGLINEATDGDLTPKPLRRVLFPFSNTTAKQATSDTHKAPLLPSLVRRSPRLQKCRDILAKPTGSVLVAADEKENTLPEDVVQVHADQFLHGLFEDDADVALLPPLTPTPKRRSERLASRTPGRTPSREIGTSIIPNLRRSPNNTQCTPRNKNSVMDLFFDDDHDLTAMTPFSRGIHGLFNATPTGKTPKSKKGTPRITFDFPDLPSLQTSSPMSHPKGLDLNFSELETDRLVTDIEPLTTDLPMPSSPPEWAGLDDFLNMDMTQWIDAEEDASFRTPKKGQGSGIIEEKTPRSLRRSSRRVRQD